MVEEEEEGAASRARVTTKSTEREIRNFILLLDSGLLGCFLLNIAGVSVVWDGRQSRQ